MKIRNKFLATGMALMLFIIGCTSSSIQQAEKNKQLFIQGIEAVNNRNWDALDDLIAPNYVRHCQATPDVTVRSLEDFKAFLKQDATTFPDFRITIDKIVAEGDLVAFYCTFIGTQKGQMGPFPPSDKQMTLELAGVHRVADGKLVETWQTWDNMASLMQLGHLPPPTEAEQP